jgi:hypothetical protein
LHQNYPDQMQEVFSNVKRRGQIASQNTIV